MIYIPILSALALAIGTIMQRKVLKHKKIDIKLYHCGEFLALTLAMVPFIYFFWKLSPQALEPMNLFIFGLVVLFSIIANLLLFFSLKWEKVTNLEPGKVLEPLFVILLAIVFSFFFTEELFEKNYNIIIPAIIAGLALVASHIEKHHLDFNKYFIAMIFSSFFFALELVISRLILDFYSPLSFYFLRSITILIISVIIFRPKFSKINKRMRFDFVIIGMLWPIYRVSMYWGYEKLGIISTTLLLMLAPIFLYGISYFYLDKKIKWRNFIASLIIVACIVYSMFS
ncbi:MAG: DMT family transporter [archaeon]